MSSHSERDLLNELFPETARELFGDHGAGNERHATLGLFPITDGRLALVSGDRLFELEPVEPAGRSACHCDLCHVTRSRSEVGIYRVQIAPRVHRYVTLCLGHKGCQGRAGRAGLTSLVGSLSVN